MKIKILTANEPTLNGIIYDEKCLKIIMDQYWERSDSFFCSLNNASPPLGAPNISAQVINMWIINNTLYADIIPVNNLPNGNGELHTELENYISYGISAKAEIIENKVNANTLFVSHINGQINHQNEV